MRRQTLSRKHEHSRRREGGERRCIVTRASGGRRGLVRFVVSPDGMIVPDVAEALPGRGIWVTSSKDCLDKAVERKLFAKAAQSSVEVPENLGVTVEELLLRRCQEFISLARRSGDATAGNAKVKAALEAGRSGLLLEATDGADGGRRKMRHLAEAVVEESEGEVSLDILSPLTGAELAEPFGRDFVVHAFVARSGKSGGLAEKIKRESARLSGIRNGDDLEKNAERCIQGAAHSMGTE